MQVTKGANKNRMSLTKMSAGQADRITDLELQLKEARAHNDYLKGANEIIAHQLAVYVLGCLFRKGGTRTCS